MAHFRLVMAVMIIVLLVSPVESRLLVNSQTAFSAKQISTIDKVNFFNKESISTPLLRMNPISKRMIALKDSKQCVQSLNLFNSELNIFLDLLNSASDQSSKGYSCSSGNCQLNGEVEKKIVTLTKQIPKLKQCLDRTAICQKMLFISYQMGLRETALFAKIAAKMGSSNEIIQAILLESPLYQFSNILSSFLKYARGELC